MSYLSDIYIYTYIYIYIYTHTCIYEYVRLKTIGKCWTCWAFLSSSSMLRFESYHTYQWVMSHIWMGHVTQTWRWRTAWCSSSSHVAHMNESCHTCEWVMSYIRMSHITHMNGSYDTHVNAASSLLLRFWSCHTYEWVVSLMLMSLVIHTHTHSVCVNESRHTLSMYECLPCGLSPFLVGTFSLLGFLAHTHIESRSLSSLFGVNECRHTHKHTHEGGGQLDVQVWVMSHM